MKVQKPLLQVIVALTVSLGIITGGVPVSVSAPPSAWQSTTNYPLTIENQSCVVSFGLIYCIGGGIGVPTGLNATNLTYFATLSSTGISPWTATTKYPLFIVDQSCVESSGYVYCIGGNDPNGPNGPPVYNATYFAPLSSSGIGVWSRTTNYPLNITGQSCAAYSAYVYCISGQTIGGFLTSATYFAPLSAAGIGAWSRTADYPTSFYFSSCVANSGFIYCIGGGNGAPSTNTVYFAPLSSSGIGTWSSTTNYPVSVWQQSCVVDSGLVYCIGGWDHVTVYLAVLSTSGVSSWATTENYPTSVQIADQGCVASSGFVYCIAGNIGGTLISNDYFASFASFVVQDPTSISVSCNPSDIAYSTTTQCTAIMTDNWPTPTSPGGTVVFSSNNGGTFTPTNSCTLGSTSPSTSTCTATVGYTPSPGTDGMHTITGVYGSDSTHQGKSGAYGLLVTGFDFGLSNSGPLGVNPNSSGFSTITITLTSSPAALVTLSVTGIPPGSSATFPGSCGSPCKVTPTTSVVLTITAGSPSGVYSVTVTGTAAAGFSRSTSFIFVINGANALLAVGGGRPPLRK